MTAQSRHWRKIGHNQIFGTEKAGPAKFAKGDDEHGLYPGRQLMHKSPQIAFTRLPCTTFD